MKLKIVQFYYSKDLVYLQESEKINLEYCKKHDIDYYCETDSDLIKEALENRAGSWYKIPFLRQQLEISEADYIAYIDSDAFVANDEVDMRDIITQYPEYDLILGEDFGPDLVNGGVLIFKNTDWSKDFLQRVWDKSEKISRGRYKREIWLEQTILSTFLLVNDADMAKTKILSHNMPNSINSLHLNEDTFIYHDLSKTRISDFYKLRTGQDNPLSHVNLTTSSDRQVSYAYFDYYISVIKQKNEQGITPNILDVGGDGGIVFGCLIENTSLNFNYLCLTDKKSEKDYIQTVEYSYLSDDNMEKFLSSNTLEFDIIIDDNSHKSTERNYLILKLFPILKKDGVYVVEDLQTDKEITNPQKNSQYGWGDPEKKCMTQLIEQFKIDQTFDSDYYDFEEIKHTILDTEIHQTRAGALLGLIYKK